MICCGDEVLFLLRQCTRARERRGEGTLQACHGDSKGMEVGRRWWEGVNGGEGGERGENGGRRWGERGKGEKVRREGKWR